jgi:broad specificity phosphatase PhoE
MRASIARPVLLAVFVSMLLALPGTGRGSEGDSTAVDSVAPPLSRPIPITVYVVRHAEQVRDGSKDPALSGLGTQRARALRNQMKSARLSAVFSTPYRRSQGTALPTTQAYEIEINTYEPIAYAKLATRIRDGFPGKSVLIIGHSNTVPKIVEALGGPRYEDLGHDEFDKLFVLAVYDDTTTCARLSYGEKFKAVPEH